eukprot:Hpha_TRINITY_DN16954_c0_g2::TRINITY_DN16954_c0_g2_i7::g.56160::m.56160
MHWCPCRSSVHSDDGCAHHVADDHPHCVSVNLPNCQPDIHAHCVANGFTDDVTDCVALIAALGLTLYIADGFSEHLAHVDADGVAVSEPLDDTLGVSNHFANGV